MDSKKQFVALSRSTPNLQRQPIKLVLRVDALLVKHAVSMLLCFILKQIFINFKQLRVTVIYSYMHLVCMKSWLRHRAWYALALDDHCL